MDTPGITVAPIEMINGVREFAEVFFDDVVVPADRILGEVNGGWAVAMSILPYERSSCFWQRIAYLYRRLEQVVEVAPDDDRSRGGRRQRVPAAPRAARPVARDAAPARRRARRSARRRRSTRCSSRPRSRRPTTRRAGCCPASSRSDDSAAGEMWRTEYLYSRAATIYGGTAEVQRNIIARRLLDLGSRRLMDAGRARAARRDGPRRARARRATRPPTSTPRSPALGWLEMLDAEPRDAIDIVFTALGATNARGDRARRRRRRRARVRAARRPRGAAARRSATWAPAGRIDAERVPRGRARDARASRPPTELLVVCTTGVGSCTRSTVPVDAVDGRARAAASIPTPGFHVVRVEHAAGRRHAVRRRPRGTAAVAAGRRAVAHQIAGASRTMLDARAHARAASGCSSAARSRAFQAVRHRLADALVAVEALDADARRGRRRAEPAHRRAREGDRRAAPRGPSPRTASRCSPGSASPPTTRSTASSSARWCSKASSDRADEIAADLGASCSRPRSGADADRAVTHPEGTRRERLRRPTSTRSTSSATTTFVADPYPYFEHLRGAVPGAARAAPRRRDGHRLRRGDRGVPRHRDVLVVQLGDRTVPRASRSRSSATT